MRHEVVIAGGGIGGLATAAAFAQRGWAVSLYERQPELRTVGSGIYIWENGLKVLEALGAYEDACEDGVFFGKEFEHRDQANRIIDSFAVPPGSRLVTIMRSQLLECLRRACVRHGVKIHTGMEAVGATARGELRFANGEVSRGDLAIGVDGVWSRVRSSLGIECVHRVTREGCLRTIVPASQEDFGAKDRSKYIENWRGERRLLITPTSDRRVYLALTCPDDDLRAKRIPIERELWCAEFPHWAHLIERIGPEVTWGLYSIIQCREWSLGRTAILGDAAHAQPPNLGQGGGMAMQNGLALAACMEGLQDPRDIPERLAVWEAEVRPLTELCQRWSTLYGEVAFLPDEVRSKVFEGVSRDAWLAEQVMAAANSIPLGSPGRPRPQP